MHYASKRPSQVCQKGPMVIKRRKGNLKPKLASLAYKFPIRSADWFWCNKTPLSAELAAQSLEGPMSAHMGPLAVD